MTHLCESRPARKRSPTHYVGRLTLVNKSTSKSLRFKFHSFHSFPITGQRYHPPRSSATSCSRKTCYQTSTSASSFVSSDQQTGNRTETIDLTFHSTKSSPSTNDMDRHSTLTRIGGRYTWPTTDMIWCTCCRGRSASESRPARLRLPVVQPQRVAAFQCFSVSFEEVIDGIGKRSWPLLICCRCSELTDPEQRTLDAKCGIWHRLWILGPGSCKDVIREWNMKSDLMALRGRIWTCSC